MRAELPWFSIALAGACLLLRALPDAGAWQLDTAHAAEWWRYWSAHLVHFSTPHALGDAAAILVLGSIAEAQLGGRWLGLYLLAGAPLLSLAVLSAAPAMTVYRGASGLACVLAVLAAAVVWRQYPRRRLLVCALAGLFVLRAYLGLDGASLAPGVSVAWQIHVLGALWGGACLLMIRVYQATPATGELQ